MFYKEGVKNTETKLQAAINNVINVDIPAVENIEFGSRYKLKKLLAVLSTLVPYKPNIKELSDAIDTNRNLTVKYLSLLANAKLLNLVSFKSKTIGDLTKPIKCCSTIQIYRLFLVKTQISVVQENLFVNQLKAVSNLSLANQGDFIVDKYTLK